MAEQDADASLQVRAHNDDDTANDPPHSSSHALTDVKVTNMNSESSEGVLEVEVAYPCNTSTTEETLMPNKEETPIREIPSLATLAKRRCHVPLCTRFANVHVGALTCVDISFHAG